MTDFGRLNEAERRVLRMLAEGHTAKSIALAIGSTPAAVNERLREARRKTGVGSSRELARLLRAQENGHEQIGVAAEPGPESPGAAEAAARRRHLGVLAMLGLLLGTAGAAALMIQQPNSQTNQVDPLIGAPLPQFKDPTDLYAKVRAEQRDAEWATRMEAAIRERVLKIPLVGKDGNVLRVTCGRTLCEIAGTLIGEVPRDSEYDPKLPLNRAISDLQDKPLNDDLAKLGLKREVGSFQGGKGEPKRSVFMLYYSRAG